MFSASTVREPQIKNGCLVISAWGILYYAFLWLRAFEGEDVEDGAVKFGFSTFEN